MNGVLDVSPCEEVGEVYIGVKNGGQAVNVSNRNKLVRQSSQDHEPNDETSHAQSDMPSLTHSDSGRGRSLGLGESQEEDSNTIHTLYRSVSNPYADSNSHEAPRRLSHADSGHGKSLVLGESLDEEKTSFALQRSSSQPGTGTKGHAQGQYLTIGEIQHKKLHCVQRSASQPCPCTQSHEPPRILTHSDSGQGPSIVFGESQEKESIYHNGVKFPSSYRVVSNNDSDGLRSSDTMSYLAIHHGTENIDSGIEKTPSIPGTIFPFPPENSSLEISTDDNQIVIKNDITTRDQKKKELEGPVYPGKPDSQISFLNSSKCFSNISSQYCYTNCNDSSISSPECSVVTSSFCSNITESRHSVPCPPMVSKSSFDQMSRELSRKKEEIENLEKSLCTLKKKNDELNKEILLQINSAKSNFEIQLSQYREENLRLYEMNIQLTEKINELNNLMQGKNKYIEQIEKENKDLKTRSDFVEEKLEKLWIKESQCQENVRRDQELNLAVRQNLPSEDDTIPKEPFSNPNLSIKSLP